MAPMISIRSALFIVLIVGFVFSFATKFHRRAAKRLIQGVRTALSSKGFIRLPRGTSVHLGELANQQLLYSHSTGFALDRWLLFDLRRKSQTKTLPNFSILRLRILPIQTEVAKVPNEALLQCPPPREAFRLAKIETRKIRATPLSRRSSLPVNAYRTNRIIVVTRFLLA